MTQWVKAFAIKLDTFKFNSLDPRGGRGETTTGFPVASTCILWYMCFVCVCVHTHAHIHTHKWNKNIFLFLKNILFFSLLVWQLFSMLKTI